VEVSLNKIKSHLPNAFVGMDVIVGFPGETEEEFFDTYRRLAELPWTRIHVFPYSSRPGTKAALRSDLIERSEILRRSERLKVLSRERYLEQAKLQIGTVKEGLRLQKPSKGAQFLTRDYWPVYVEDDSKWTLINEDSRIEITGYRDAGGSAMDGILVGKLI
jgi:threonylcarbamoyladenosine tRNA methylthiotransferase MtaB